MSSETKDASMSAPHAILLAIVASSAMGYVYIVALLICIQVSAATHKQALMFLAADLAWKMSDTTSSMMHVHMCMSRMVGAFDTDTLQCRTRPR